MRWKGGDCRNPTSSEFSSIPLALKALKMNCFGHKQETAKTAALYAASRSVRERVCGVGNYPAPEARLQVNVPLFG